VFDPEKSENDEGRQVLAPDEEPAAEADDLETGDASGSARKRRFGPDEASRRKPREVRSRSLALAPPPPGI
jgi:hypothetical protein